MATKKCILYERNCISCGECNICDLDCSKTCDNCGKCIDFDMDYIKINIDEIITDED